jgi:chemotaxis methyl-accepting protein methylase
MPPHDISGRLRERLGNSYLFLVRGFWKHLPASFRLLPPGQLCGSHLHTLVRRYAVRGQSFGTFFLRNRPELELMRALANQHTRGDRLAIAVLACSKGAEVYSIVWVIRSARPDLKLDVRALDMSRDILAFAEQAVYSSAANHDGVPARHDVATTTWQDQIASMFERLTDEEIGQLFEVEGNRLSVKPWLKEGISWVHGDAGDPAVIDVLGPQDVVVANRFLCHMEPATAERCLRNIARLVKPGGYLFVSGIDLDVRTRVARDMGWTPITHRIRDIHDGDRSLRQGWPLQYWGLEPLRDDLSDWTIRYASVFQVNQQGGIG